METKAPVAHTEKTGTEHAEKPSRFHENDHNGDDYHYDTAAQAEKLENVLHGLSKEELFNGVDQFVKEHHLEEFQEVFQKGALLAQRPHEYMTMPELTEDDKAKCDYEKAHKWHFPWQLYYSVILCAIGAATQVSGKSDGADYRDGIKLGQTEQEFGVGATYNEPGGPRDEWIVGFVNSAPYICAALLVSDPLNNLFGRRGEIFITSIILIATPIGSAFTQSWQAFAAVRIVLGIGLGAKAATVPMYAAELAPAHVRGALVMGWQLWTAFGIFLGNCANAVVKDTGKIAWRLQIGSAFIPAVPLAIGIFFCPESPRWYIKKNRLPEAWRAIQRIRSTQVQAARDLYYAYVQLKEEQKIIQGRTYFTRLIELFTIPRVRRATQAGLVVHIAQQMCGINVIAFYSSTVFLEGGFSESDALYASIGFGALNFVFAWVALFTIDTFGRRALLCWSFPNMSWSLLLVGFMFWIHDTTTRTGLVAFWIYIYTIFYSVGEGPVPFMYSAEIFPLAQREQGTALCVGWNNLWASILSLTFPRLLRAFKPQGAFGFYAGMNMIAWFMIFCLVPETKLLTLEELDHVFNIPTRRFTGFHLGTMAPYKFRKWFFRSKDPEPELYQLDKGIQV